MQLGYFQVIALPVSTWVQEIFEFTPSALPRFVTKLKIPPFPCLSPGYQFWIVEYLTSASSRATSSTTAAWSWFVSRIGAVQLWTAKPFAREVWGSFFVSKLYTRPLNARRAIARMGTR